MPKTTQPTPDDQEPPADATTPPQPPVTVPAAVIASTLETLNLLDQFFRLHASPATRADLHHFAGLHGWDPVQGADALVDNIGLDARQLTRAHDSIKIDQSH